MTGHSQDLHGASEDSHERKAQRKKTKKEEKGTKAKSEQNQKKPGRTKASAPTNNSNPPRSANTSNSKRDTGEAGATIKATPADWLEGARPHTWANAFAPVIAGTGAAAASGHTSLTGAVLAAIVAWALIIGVNYANDYSDGIRGTDDDRSGPQRLTASGLVPPEYVKYAAFVAFGIAGIAGIALSVSSGHAWLIVVGIACVLAAWFYTGGSHPYGYMGLGEVAVFIFFGLVAVLGTQYTQADEVTMEGLTIAIAVGSMSSAVNLANNLRDIPTDKEAGKTTLAVRLGDRGTRILWCILAALPLVVTLALAVTYSLWAILGLAALPLLLAASRPITSGAQGKDLIPVLGSTGRAMVVWSVLTALGLALAQLV